MQKGLRPLPRFEKDRPRPARPRTLRHGRGAFALLPVENEFAAHILGRFRRRFRRSGMPRLNGSACFSFVIRLSCPVLRRRLSLARYRLRPHSFACGKLSRKLSRRLSHPVGMGEHEGMRSRAYAPLSLRAFSRGFVRFRARGKSPRVFPKGKGRDYSRPLCCRSFTCSRPR